MIQYNGLNKKNETYIVAMCCLWAALDIFSHRIFMVYLKVTHLGFVYRTKTAISMTAPLLGSEFSGVYRLLIYMCNICTDLDSWREPKYVT